MPITFSPELAKTLLSISITILGAVCLDFFLRSLIRVPAHFNSFDTRRGRTYTLIVRNLITVLVYVIAAYIIFIELGVNLTPLLASAGIVGIALGLGARALIEDLIAGFFLLSQDSIAVGDDIKIDDSEGKIEKIGFRTITIKSGTGALYIIPNGQVKKVTNLSRYNTKFTVDVTMRADQPIDTVIKAANEALTALQKEKDLEGFVLPGSAVKGIDDFKTEGHMVITTLLISKYDNQVPLARRYRYLIKKIFEKRKITID